LESATHSDVEIIGPGIGCQSLLQRGLQHIHPKLPAACFHKRESAGSLHIIYSHEALVMFTLKEGSHSVFNWFIPVGDGSHNGKGILSTGLFAYCFFTSAILLCRKRK